MSFKRCFFSKIACQMFAKCVDDPQVLELLQKCFVRIKTAKQITAISHETEQKTEKKTATMKKERLIRC